MPEWPWASVSESFTGSQLLWRGKITPSLAVCARIFSFISNSLSHSFLSPFSPWPNGPHQPVFPLRPGWLSIFLLSIMGRRCQGPHLIAPSSSAVTARPTHPYAFHLSPPSFSFVMSMHVVNTPPLDPNIESLLQTEASSALNLLFY